MLESLLIKLKASNFIKKRLQHRCFHAKFTKFSRTPIFKSMRLQHRCFPAKFAKFSRTPIFKSICERLLLIFRTERILFRLCLANFIRFNINRVQSRYFFKWIFFIGSNAAISVMHKLKNVSLTLQSKFSLNSY